MPKVLCPACGSWFAAVGILKNEPHCSTDCYRQSMEAHSAARSDWLKPHRKGGKGSKTTAATAAGQEERQGQGVHVDFATRQHRGRTQGSCCRVCGVRTGCRHSSRACVVNIARADRDAGFIAEVNVDSHQCLGGGVQNQCRSSGHRDLRRQRDQLLPAKKQFYKANSRRTAAEKATAKAISGLETAHTQYDAAATSLEVAKTTASVAAAEVLHADEKVMSLDDVMRVESGRAAADPRAKILDQVH